MKEKWKSGNISKATRDNLFKSGDNRIGKETQFEKGHMPWIKGKTHSKETRKIMSNVLSEQYKEGTRVPPMLGKKHSEETKETIRVKKIGSKLSIKTRKKLSRSLKGK